MNKKVIELGNTIYWDRNEGDKVYLDHVHISIRDLPFATRQVFVRFAKGPELDFSLIDMDRLAIEYLKLRGVKLPPEVSELANAERPPRCDFLLPKSLVSELLKKEGSKRSSRPG